MGWLAMGCLSLHWEGSAQEQGLLKVTQAMSLLGRPPFVLPASGRRPEPFTLHLGAQHLHAYGDLGLNFGRPGLSPMAWS